MCYNQVFIIALIACIEGVDGGWISLTINDFSVIFLVSRNKFLFYKEPDPYMRTVSSPSVTPKVEFVRLSTSRNCFLLFTFITTYDPEGMDILAAYRVM